MQKTSPGRISGFTLIELMIVVAILGILAVVAIPAFVRYMRIAKTSEAYRMINKMAKGAIRYYSLSWPNASGTPQKCQFPRDGGFRQAPMSDYHGCCTDGEPDGKCEPNEAAWNPPLWQALLFKIADKHYYIYEYAEGPVSGKIIGDKSDVGLFAIGDLDCDGTYAKFGLGVMGRTTDANEILNCTARQWSSFRVTNETE